MDRHGQAQGPAPTGAAPIRRGNLDAVMRKELPGTGLWIDNSALTADQTVDMVLERVLSEGIVAA